jgi:hypothetical protein
MKTRGKKKNKIWLSFSLCLVFIFVSGGFLFLGSMEDLMVKNLELRALEEELSSLESEKRGMESMKNSLESFENISLRLEDLSMVKVSDLEYISAGDDSLAKR